MTTSEESRPIKKEVVSESQKMQKLHDFFMDFLGIEIERFFG